MVMKVLITNMKVKKIILLISILFSTNCSFYNYTDQNYGFISMSVKFPPKGFSIKVIPANTYSIMVEIDGENMAKSTVFNLTRNNPSRTIIAQIGKKNINATALDINGNTLAKGKNTINILSRLVSYKAEITLIPVNKDLNNNHNPNPDVQKPHDGDNSEFPPIIIIGTDKPDNNQTTPTASPSPTLSVQPTSVPSYRSGSGGSGRGYQGSVNADIEVIDGEPFNGDINAVESPQPFSP